MRSLFVSFTSLSAALALTACSGSTTPTPPPETVTLSGRRGQALAYDEARHQLLLFGGQGTEQGSSITDQRSLWKWDGTKWTRIATDGPSARNHASMIYDPAKQVVLLYGGRSGTFPNEVVYTDTWEWNGTAWTQRATTGPGARVHQTMAYDRVRGRAILFGGFDMQAQTELLDIWEWNGTAWTKSNATINAATARGTGFDEKTGMFFLFSADAAGAVHADVWNGTTAVRRSEAVPACLGNPVSTGSTRGGLFSAEYCEASSAMQSYKFDGSTWTTLSGAQPTGPRINYTSAYDRDADKVYIFGGESLQGNIFGDTWAWDGTSWTKVGG